LAVTCFLVLGIVALASITPPAVTIAAPGGHGRPTPTPSPTPTPGGPTPPPVAGSWTLTFADEFNGSSVDLTKWRPNWAFWIPNGDAIISKPVNVAELACYDPAAVTEANGVLTLTATHQSCTDNDGITYAYRSGLVTSANHYTFTYGYMEARMWLPANAAGTPIDWPAFWANGIGTWPTTGEIDVMEVLGGTDPLCWHFHYSGGAPGGCASMADPAGWHTFGADWQPRSITFYYDGVRVGRISKGITSAPMYLILNLAISSTVGGPLSVPAHVDVDSVHVWQHP
jgi:beta-glucanase (GH16 family)